MKVIKVVKCLRCGRLLKETESKKRGYGLICYKKHMKEKNKYKERRLI